MEEIENTGGNSTPVILLGETIYKDSYCLSVSEGICTHETTIYSITESHLKEMGVEILAVILMFGFAVGFLVMLIKWVFYLFMPNRGKKTLG